MTESQGCHSLTPCIFQQTTHTKISLLLHHTHNRLTSRGFGFRGNNFPCYFSHKSSFSYRSLWFTESLRTPHRILLEAESLKNKEIFEHTQRVSFGHRRLQQPVTEEADTQHYSHTSRCIDFETYLLTVWGNWMFQYCGNRQLMWWLPGMPFQPACTGVSGGIRKPFKTTTKKVKVKPLSYLNVSILVHKLYPVPSSDVRFSRMSYGCKPLQVLIKFLLLNHTVEFHIPPLCWKWKVHTPISYWNQLEHCLN